MNYAMDYPHKFDTLIRWKLLMARREHSKRHALEFDRMAARYFEWAKVYRFKPRLTAIQSGRKKMYFHLKHQRNTQLYAV